jgi:hypothetical protein
VDGHVPVVVDGRDRDRRPHPLRHDRPRRCDGNLKPLGGRATRSAERLSRPPSLRLLRTFRRSPPTIAAE